MSDVEPCACGHLSYADPQFVPGMVVAALDRQPDDMRTWHVSAPMCPDDTSPLKFLESWSSAMGTDGGYVAKQVSRSGLPKRLCVVNSTGRAEVP